MRTVYWIVFISALLPVVRRIAMFYGVDLDFSQADFFGSNASATAYIPGLEAIQALVGTLCPGLIYSWGDRAPRWRPLLGSRRIPTFLPLTLGEIGNALLYRISATPTTRFGSVWLGLTNGRTPADGTNGWQVAILAAAHAPMLLLWASALTIGLIGYWRRCTTR